MYLFWIQHFQIASQEAYQLLSFLCQLFHMINWQDPHFYTSYIMHSLLPSVFIGATEQTVPLQVSWQEGNINISQENSLHIIAKSFRLSQCDENENIKRSCCRNDLVEMQKETHHMWRMLQLWKSFGIDGACTENLPPCLHT